jgi:hypothetical protein
VSFYKMERGWQDSEFFKGEEFSTRDAWEWLVADARWKEGTVNILGNPIFLTRGQLCHSVRFMAEKFMWSIGRTQRFIKKLQKWNMISVSTNTGQTIITICNYSKYQDDKQASDMSTDTPIDTPPDTQAGTKKKKDKESKEGKKRKRLASRPDCVSENVWDDFISQRKTDFTETALMGIQRQAEKAGWALERVLAYAVTRGWQSFEADWVKENRNESIKSNNTRPTKSDRANAAAARALERLGYADQPDGEPVFRQLEHLREGTGTA